MINQDEQHGNLSKAMASCEGLGMQMSAVHGQDNSQLIETISALDAGGLAQGSALSRSMPGNGR